jgi:hypothetical protein
MTQGRYDGASQEWICPRRGVSVDAIAAFAAAGRSFITSLPVQANPAVLGTDVFLQGAAFDTGANPGPMAFSNGLTAHFGSR